MDSPGFDDHLLKWLATSVNDICPYGLSSLNIENCTNFNLRSLREFIKARNKASAETDSDDENFRWSSAHIVLEKFSSLRRIIKAWFIKNEPQLLCHGKFYVPMELMRVPGILQYHELMIWLSDMIDLVYYLDTAQSSQALSVSKAKTRG